MLDLDGRFALVTGGASGIGAAVSERLQQQGLRVASRDVRAASKCMFRSRGLRGLTRIKLIRPLD